jgi:hypothetical protein
VPESTYHENRLVQAGNRRSSNTLIIPVTARSVHGMKHLIQCRKVDQPENDLTLNLEGYLNRPIGSPAHEIACAVDGVDDPSPSGTRRGKGPFFADQSVLGKGIRHEPADQPFAFPVGDRNG